MDIRQIEFFVAVAQELNFTRAAELTHVTQSGLSASIRGLERELRTQLFDRTPRSVALTPAGHAFLPRARRMLNDAHAAQRELRSARSQEIFGTLSVGTEQCLGDGIDMPDILAAFQKRFPGVSIRFEQLGSEALLDRLRREELDAALLAQPAGPADLVDGSFTSFEMSRSGFELVMAPAHPLASNPRPEWSDLEEHAFVDFDTTWTARRIIDSAFSRRKLARRSAYNVNDVHMLLDLVRKGVGVALIPSPHANKLHAEGLVRRPLEGADLEWVVHFVTTAERTAPAELFAEMMFTAEILDETREGISQAAEAAPVG